MSPLNSHKKRAIRRGKLKAEASFDLHGMRSHEAREAVDGFLATAIERGYRAVIIITGKGKILRESLPRWLEAPALRPHILSIEEALPRDGGSGAFMILLRRQREQSEE